MLHPLHRASPLLLLGGLAFAAFVAGENAQGQIHPQEPATEAAVLAVTNAEDSGPSTLRDILTVANEAGLPVRIEIRLEPPAIIELRSSLPPLRAPGAVLDGGGALLRSHPDCSRPDDRFGCDGLVIRGPGITVRNLNAQGFLFDGFAIRGPRSVGSLIRGCAAMDNSDDGFGVSEGATGVEIRDCVSMDNGFRTKGKGILVFDDSEALLVGNVLIGNRDGLTVSRRAKATMIDTAVVGSFDKGVGVAGATLEGRGNLIAANGLGGSEPAPNADGLRATLGSRIHLIDTEISANGDTGVIALQGSDIQLDGGRVTDSGRYGVAAATKGMIGLLGTAVSGSETADFHLHDSDSFITESAEALAELRVLRDAALKAEEKAAQDAASVEPAP